MKHKPSSAALLAERFLSPGDTVIEVGAADGAYTEVYAARVGPTGRVLAIDPHPGHVRQLIALAEVYPQVTVLSMAVGASIGEALFYPDRTAPKRSSLYWTNVADPGEAALVRVTTIDALVESLGHAPALIQVDAQGAEAGILAGALSTLGLPAVWVIELWPAGLLNARASADETMGYFQAQTYSPYSVRGAPMTWHEAHEAVATREGVKHADFVMVPETLAGVGW